MDYVLPERQMGIVIMARGNRPKIDGALVNILCYLLSHHIASVIGTALTVAFAASVLQQRRPPGSAMAWILVILLAPYIGIPLFLVFGGRKFRRKVRKKSQTSLWKASDSTIHQQLAPSAPPQERATRLEWLDDGVAAYEVFLREIQDADESIRIMTFVIGDDEAGQSILDALTRRATAGIRVLLLLDDLLRFRAPRGHLSRLVAAGGRVVRFMPLIHLPFRARSNLRNHRKIAIFDGKRAILGGMNLANEYMGPQPLAERWRDLSVFVEGSCVASLDAVFRSDWRFATSESLPSKHPPAAYSSDGAPVQVIPSGPDGPGDDIYDAILYSVYTAKRRIWIATPYFIPDEALVKALEIAVRRGVEVRVVVPMRSNHALADLIGVAILRDLTHAGVHVFHYRPAMLHAKVLLVDDQLATVGSANFDMRSLFLDFEIALLFTGGQEVAQVATWFEATLAGASEALPRVSRLRSFAEPWARLLSPLV